MSPTQNADKLATVLKAWSDLRPNKSFAGMTLDQFKAAIKPSTDARAAADKAVEDQQVAIAQRDKADVASLPIIKRVVAAVVADEAEGDDGELYEQMGYVRSSQRGSGLHRNSPAPAPTPPAPAAK